MTSSRSRAAAAVAGVIMVGGAGCGAPGGNVPAGTLPPAPTPSSASPAPTTLPAPATPTPAPASTPEADPRWRFFTDDTTHYVSPWYAGAHRIMIGFGCTAAPYYRPDARCSAGRGFHHGIDVAIPCGVPLYSAVAGRVIQGGLGPAYGSKAFRIRTDEHDLLIGHARAIVVSDGDRVTPGQPIAEVGALGAPDGCHLHLEQRTVGGAASSATDPAAVLALSR